VRHRGRNRPLEQAALGRKLLESVDAQGAGKETEAVIVRAGRTRVLALSGTPLTNAGGDRIGTLHIIRDITEIKALEEQSKRGERLSAMGEMAVELAHEIRNPLGGIELFASLLESEVTAGGDAARWAENIRIGSRSLNNIVSNMLHFANPLAPIFAPVSLHEVVREVLQFMGPIMAQRDVRVTEQFDADNPVIEGDRELLKQMLLNLVHNSMQAMPSRGSLTVATRDLRPDVGFDSGGRLELSIGDTGVGIPPEHLERVFDPFFTTNRSGTGLGLSVVHQIVDRHAGCITVASEINRGTQFTITFPRTRAAAHAA
jgi:signal transduction histidine kinase